MPDNGKPPKTTDERIDAIAQSVELLAAMQLKTERQIFRLGKFIRMIVMDHESRLLELEGEGPEEEAQK